MNLAQCAPGYIRSLSAYVPGKPVSELARELGLKEDSIIKLASNENPFGPSPKALAAMQDMLADIALYPDGSGYALKQALSRKHGLGVEHFVLGNGSNELLDLAARCFVSPGACGIYSQYAFAVYPLAIQSAGGQCVEVASRFFAHDLAAMADAITADTRIMFIANPNNPTGSFAPGPLLESFLDVVPPDVLVVLDEAYHGYLPAELRYDSIPWIKRFPNLIVSRTFSKIYGLAGLRVGYMVADPAVADLLNRVRAPFNVNSLALVAAEAALADDVFVQHSHDMNRTGMAQMLQGLSALNLTHIPSCGNFVAVRVGNAQGVNQRLLKQGVIVRPIANYGMPEWLRVTIGDASENKRFLEALEIALKG